MFGLLPIDKPAGCTSHDVVGFVRWALQEPSVGHTGTLDPPATGLLLLLLGTATRLSPYLSQDDKRYLARFALGRATHTADATGETIAEGPWCPEDLDRAALQLGGMTGTRMLAPPAVSAIKVAGKASHGEVRRGRIPDLAPRPMDIHSVEILVTDPVAGTLDARIHVGKGTYIRSLATELGAGLGLPVHLAALRRETVGSWRVDGPGVVDGVCVTPLEARPGAKPRVRLRLDGVGEDRAALAARLAEGVRSPEEALTDPVVSRPGGDTGLAALSQGRQVAGSDLLELAGATGWVQGPDVLIRVEPHQGRYRPVRLIHRHHSNGAK